MQPQKKILAVDDNPSNIAILKELLDDDYNVETAATGEEALEMIPNFRPDLILLDIMMPGIDGYEVCKQIRKNPDFRATKIIMVSAKAMVSERIQGYEAGADDYLTKPFDEDELLSKVRVFLRLKSVEEVDRLKTDVLSLLCHEVQTPLNDFMLPAEILKSDEEMSTEKRKRFGELLHRKAKRLLTFFEKALALSSMKAGRWKFNFTRGRLCDVVREVIGKVQGKAAEQDVQIVEDMTEKCVVTFDAKEIRRVVLAILDNAIRFSPPNGQITVSIASDDGDVRLSITDQGRGINPELLPRVFDEFCCHDDLEDAEADLGEYQDRQGLDLAIARQVVMHHNGSIDVDSKRDIETTFNVCFPITGAPDVSIDGEVCAVQERAALQD